MTKREAAAAKLTAAYQQILEAFDDLGYPVKTDANFTETAARAGRAMLELVKPTDEIKSQVDEMLSRTFPAQYDEMVISKHNISFGMCPHHLLPVIYRISVAYLPGERVLGISKLSRIVQLLAHRPVLQEDLTQELAALLHERLETRGSAG
ncbi:MAG TPA: GTP cyclohydrolase I [Polyangia bacterium]